jgi:hypothetical protein
VEQLVAVVEAGEVVVDTHHQRLLSFLVERIRFLKLRFSKTDKLHSPQLLALMPISL